MKVKFSKKNLNFLNVLIIDQNIENKIYVLKKKYNLELRLLDNYYLRNTSVQSVGQELLVRTIDVMLHGKMMP